MNYKKWYIFLIFIFILVILIGGVILGQSREKADINLMEIEQCENKDNEYFQYISRKVALEIKDKYDFTNVEIDVNHMNEDMISVDVHISGEDIEKVEAEIKSYVSQCFGVPLEDVYIYFD